MKTIPLHPASLLAGLAIGAGFLFLTSQTSTVTFPTARVEVGPHPRDMVRFTEGSPYTVPPGKILVISGLGHVDGNSNQPTFKVQLRINGQNVSAAYEAAGWGSATVLAVPPGLTAHWGDVVEVVTPPSSAPIGGAIAWGYLAER